MAFMQIPANVTFGFTELVLLKIADLGPFDEYRLESEKGLRPRVERTVAENSLVFRYFSQSVSEGKKKRQS